MWKDISAKMLYSWESISKMKTYPNCRLEVHSSVALDMLMKCWLDLPRILESVAFETLENILGTNIMYPVVKLDWIKLFMSNSTKYKEIRDSGLDCDCKSWGDFWGFRQMFTPKIAVRKKRLAAYLHMAVTFPHQICSHKCWIISFKMNQHLLPFK